jgi:phosphate-selective porin OprO/OprP
MSKRLALSTVGLAVFALLAAPRAWAQEEEKPEWTAKWSNGHKIEKSDGAFKLKFGGRIQADFIFASQDKAFDEALGEDAFTNGFEFRRARLFVEGTIYERIKFKAQYDFAGGDADFKDVWIGFQGRSGDLRFGHFKEFMSINEITSSKYIAFNERALPVQFFSPSRNSGVGYTGSSDKVVYGIGAFYDADDFGTSIDQDRTNVTGRIAFRPVYEDNGKSLFHIGGAFTSKQIEDGGTLRFRGRPGNHFGPRPVDTDGIPADDALVLQLEIAGVANRFWYAAEFYTLEVSTPSDADPEEVLTTDPTLDGWYAQAGYYLTKDYRRYKKSIGSWDRQKPGNPFLKSGGGGAWEVALRYAKVDLTEATNPGELSNVTFAVNWYVNPATRVMFNFVTAELSGAATIDDPAFTGTVDSFLVRFQVDF